MGMPSHLYVRELTAFPCKLCKQRKGKAKEGEVSSVKFKPIFPWCVCSARSTRQCMDSGQACEQVHVVGVWQLCLVCQSGHHSPVCCLLVRGAFLSTGTKRSNLTSFGVHIPAAKEFFHNPHVLLCFHSGEGCQHDGGVACLVLVIDITHICKKKSLRKQTLLTAAAYRATEGMVFTGAQWNGTRWLETKSDLEWNVRDVFILNQKLFFFSYFTRPEATETTVSFYSISCLQLVAEMQWLGSLGGCSNGCSWE